jgi:diaminopimelate epimerase
VAGVLSGRLEKAVDVHLPGGTLQVSWERDGKVYMEGPAEEVFNGRIKTAILDRLVEEEEAR